MHYVYNAYHESSSFFHLFKVVDKEYGINSNEKQHYNTITSCVPYKNANIYPHNKYLQFNLPITYLLVPILLITYYFAYLIN